MPAVLTALSRGMYAGSCIIARCQGDWGLKSSREYHVELKLHAHLKFHGGNHVANMNSRIWRGNAGSFRD